VHPFVKSANAVSFLRMRWKTNRWHIPIQWMFILLVVWKEVYSGTK
jgi:hypothetical protein